MTARPLTNREWHEVVVTRFPQAERTGIVQMDASTWDRIWATVENQGFAPDPPTPYELDKWAARKIMGWEQSASTWTKRVDGLVGFQNVIDQRDWKPSVDLGQALECAQTTAKRVHIELRAAGTTIVEMSFGGGTVHYFEFDEYDEAKIAEAIVRKLHAEVGS